MSDRYALITGASRGLGKWLTERFAKEGFNICLVARNVTRLEEMLTKLSMYSDREFHMIPCDLADSEAVEDLCLKVRELIPHLNVLINNAAIQGTIGPLMENDLNLWKQVLNVNLLAPVALCRSLVPFMVENRGGSIINLSGGGATSARANFTAYATSKAGLVRFSETIAEEVKAYGIRVNCIAPGAMKTSMLAEVIDKGPRDAGNQEFSLAEKVFTEGGASMDRIADLALFLASDKSSGISGKLISAVWDFWEIWPDHVEELDRSDVYTLRRIVGRDRGFVWGDK